MSTQIVTLELSDDLVRLLGSPQAAAAKAKQALVLDLLREARLSQGQAARLLSVTRGNLLDLMAKYEIPSGPVTAEEVDEEFETVSRYLTEGTHDGGRQ